MDLWTAIIGIMIVVCGSISAPFCIWQLGVILRERRRDMMEHARTKAEMQLEEMRIKSEIDSRILGSGSAVTENLTCEMQSLREEVTRLRGELEQIKSTGTNYVR